MGALRDFKMSCCSRIRDEPVPVDMSIGHGIAIGVEAFVELVVGAQAMNRLEPETEESQARRGRPRHLGTASQWGRGENGEPAAYPRYSRHR